MAVASRAALRCDTDMRTLRTVRRHVRDIALIFGGSAEEAFAVETATGEVLINVYEHAYRRKSGPIEIDLLYDEARIEITIHDDGEPIVDAPVIPRTPPAGARGRGLFLVGQLMDESEIIHPGQGGRGVAVRFVKYLRRGREATAEPQAADSPASSRSARST